MLLLTGKQAKVNDDYTQSKIGIPGLVLMERAALCIAERIENLIEENKDRFFRRRVKVIAVAGMGNNGGDAVAAARILCQREVDASLILVGNTEKATDSMKHQLKVAGNLCVDTECSFVPDGDENKLDAFRSAVEAADIIIDGLFGVGLSRDLSKEYCDIVEIINSTNAYKIAVDIPSGIDCDNGNIRGGAVKCDETVTFGFMKYGLVVNDGRNYAGKVTVSEIGLEVSPEGYDDDDISFRAIPEKRLKLLLPSRNPNSNKGTYGKVLVVAGNEEIYGAAYLSAAAAYKTGSGLVKIFTSEVNKDNLMNMLPEAMIGCYKTGDELSDEEAEQLRSAIKWADVIAVGPGLGTGKKSKEILKEVVSAGQPGKYLVIDADAINICSAVLENGMTGLGLLRKASESYDGNVVITPHMAEMARLVRATEMESRADEGVMHRPVEGAVNDASAGDSVKAVNAMSMQDTVRAIAMDRGAAALDIAQNFRITVVLKDARTHIASYNNNREVYVNLTGNSGMSKGGSGDVLTGILAAVLAVINRTGKAGAGYFTQTVAAGVMLHGAAGDIARDAKGEYGMLATDIIDALGKVL